ncbi:hypothetical protein LMG28688_04167 [Paraburkholderia caffeinitolerans]|uniref:Uncharacterized protein n=1 Tax=Paraburkholderia caffeinitolerans TaxID=1723730 RepID=A0A6J5G8E1_9BURK|nr:MULTISPECIES: hypothetical protein [Paraburkholderia]CAB3795703.1 hypothetical protein LMG28688_04167 [Paraburkholderia caffeinitolerans]
MNVDQISKFLEVLKKFKPNEKVDALYDDVLNVYLPKIKANELPERYIIVWDASIIARLRALKLGADKQSNEPIAWIPKPLGAEIPTIYFGQLRITKDFQGSLTVNQQAITGFPEAKLVGRPIEVVAAMMGPDVDDGIGPDEVPIQIFWSDEDKRWITANNRGYAAHCLAGQKPLRLWPRVADKMELNRLKEVEGKDGAKRFTYSPNLITRLGKTPHALPSTQIPITAGPNSWEVQLIAQVK